MLRIVYGHQSSAVEDLCATCERRTLRNAIKVPLHNDLPNLYSLPRQRDLPHRIPALPAVRPPCRISESRTLSSCILYLAVPHVFSRTELSLKQRIFPGTRSRPRRARQLAWVRQLEEAKDSAGDRSPRLYLLQQAFLSVGNGEEALTLALPLQ